MRLRYIPHPRFGRVAVCRCRLGRHACGPSREVCLPAGNRIDMITSHRITSLGLPISGGMIENRFGRVRLPPLIDYHLASDAGDLLKRHFNRYHGYRDHFRLFRYDAWIIGDTVR